MFLTLFLLLMNVLNVHNVFFTFLGYPMSYIEFSATILITVYVLLITKKIVWAWPIGITAFTLFAGLFYQVCLYSDFFEQFYYIGNGFYGWWLWLVSRSGENAEKNLEVSYSSGRTRLVAASIIAAGSIVLGFVMSRIHIYLPSLFPNPAAYPYIDAFATMMGFTAAVLSAHRKIESWFLWICVAVICIGLYYARNVKFVAALYIFFLALAINGLITWGRELRGKTKSSERS
jgi:nicotinamide mononucleotide transporter